MLFSQASYKEVQSCMHSLKKYENDPKALRKMKDIAESRKSNIPTFMTLPNTMLAIILGVPAIVAVLPRIPTNDPTARLAIVFVIGLTLLSYHQHVEESITNQILIEAIMMVEE